MTTQYQIPPVAVQLVATACMADPDAYTRFAERLDFEPVEVRAVWIDALNGLETDSGHAMYEALIWRYSDHPAFVRFDQLGD
jgi:hypothetical protein